MRNQPATYECQGCGGQQMVESHDADSLQKSPVCCGQPMKLVDGSAYRSVSPDEESKRKLKFKPGERVRVRRNMPYLPAPFAYTMGRTGKILYAIPDSKGFGEGEYQAYTRPPMSQLYLIELDDLQNATEEKQHLIQENWLDLLEDDGQQPS